MPDTVIKAPPVSPPQGGSTGRVDYGQEILDLIKQVQDKTVDYKNKYNKLLNLCRQYQKENQGHAAKNETLEQALNQTRQEKAAAEAKSGELERNSSALKNKIKELEKENQQLNLKLGNVNNRLQVDKDDLELIARFNNWASVPQNRLDTNFMYVSGELKIRQIQTLTESTNETRWIKNRTGKKHYIFPNPCLFDEMTDISEFYKINGSLGPKGQNKLKIIKPCEISETGFIEYPGELELLR
jgi:seryl-tRNA synthetase